MQLKGLNVHSSPSTCLVIMQAVTHAEISPKGDPHNTAQNFDTHTCQKGYISSDTFSLYRYQSKFSIFSLTLSISLLVDYYPLYMKKQAKKKVKYHSPTASQLLALNPHVCPSPKPQVASAIPQHSVPLLANLKVNNHQTY